MGTIRFGNAYPLEVYRQEVDPMLRGAELDRLAEQSGVLLSLAPDGAEEAPDDLIRARLEGVNRTRSIEGARETVISFPDDWDRWEVLTTIFGNNANGGLWALHSEDAPSWVEADDDEDLAMLVSSMIGTKTGRPKGWRGLAVNHYSPPKNDGGRTAKLIAEFVSEHIGDHSMGYLAKLASRMGLPLLTLLAIPMLRVDAGKDFQSRVMGDTASTGTGSYAAANYIALTENSTAPAASDTALTGELTTEGFARAQAAYAHTAGASTFTLTKTFTMSSGTSRTIQKGAVFNASSGGTMVFETAMPSPPTLVPSDQVAVTETVTI
jgi:hypothetical protein